jgi:hypothetical protein
MYTFKEILKDSNVVADLFANQSCDVDMDVLDYAILTEDKSSVKTQRAIRHTIKAGYCRAIP